MSQVYEDSPIFHLNASAWTRVSFVGELPGVSTECPRFSGEGLALSLRSHQCLGEQLLLNGAHQKGGHVTPSDTERPHIPLQEDQFETCANWCACRSHLCAMFNSWASTHFCRLVFQIATDRGMWDRGAETRPSRLRTLPELHSDAGSHALPQAARFFLWRGAPFFFFWWGGVRPEVYTSCGGLIRKEDERSDSCDLTLFFEERQFGCSFWIGQPKIGLEDSPEGWQSRVQAMNQAGFNSKNPQDTGLLQSHSFFDPKSPRLEDRLEEDELSGLLAGGRSVIQWIKAQWVDGSIFQHAHTQVELYMASANRLSVDKVSYWATGLGITGTCGTSGT